MPNSPKPLSEMFADEIAALSSEGLDEISTPDRTIDKLLEKLVEEVPHMQNKPLAEMTTDQIAQLTSEQFKEVAGKHNDDLELRENAANRRLTQEREARGQAMDELIAQSKLVLSPDEWAVLPFVNDDNVSEAELIYHGIPDDDDRPNPLMLRDATGTPLEKLADRAWGYDYEEALLRARHEVLFKQQREIDTESKQIKNDRDETFVEKASRRAREQSSELGQQPQRGLENGPEHDL